MILGCTGYAGVGKDSAAEFLVKQFNFTRIAFADKLRDFAYNVNPYIHHDLAHMSHDLAGIVDDIGWERAKREIIGVREFLQKTGHGARVTFGDDFWISHAFDGQSIDTDIVITDVRYDNEIKYITKLGGYIVRITREGYGPINNHITEKELPFDYTIVNSNDSRLHMDYALRELVQGLRKLGNYTF